MGRTHQDKVIAAWLLICCAAVFAMVVLGGVTRLTGSGLSMVKWEPITGVLPPRNEQQWQEVFELYREFPEYKIYNRSISLEGFKSIFWLEYAHRLLGRLIGLLFFIPLVFFAITGRITKPLGAKLVFVFALGALQGVLGWYMVKSGLVHEPHVSQYRLAAHLGLAFAIYLYMLWLALDLLYPSAVRSPPPDRPAPRRLATIIVATAFITTLSGALVAGTHAGFAYNSFPTMAGQWIPNGLFAYEPWWRNLFENVTTVQFNHRALAALVISLVLTLWLSTRTLAKPSRLKWGIHLLLAAACIQIGLGISTLLLVVPTALAAAHQGGALLLLTASTFVLHQTRTNQG